MIESKIFEYEAPDKRDEEYNKLFELLQSSMCLVLFFSLEGQRRSVIADIYLYGIRIIIKDLVEKEYLEVKDEVEKRVRKLYDKIRYLIDSFQKGEKISYEVRVDLRSEKVEREIKQKDIKIPKDIAQYFVYFLSYLPNFNKNKIVTQSIWLNSSFKPRDPRSLTEIIKSLLKLYDEKLSLNFQLLRRVIISALDKRLFEMNVSEEIREYFYKKWARSLNTSIEMLKRLFLISFIFFYFWFIYFILLFNF